MFTQPRNCCCCIGVRTGTLILAVLQILSGLGDIAYAACFDRPFANPQLYLGLFVIGAGIYGCYAVHKDNVQHVKNYKMIYWIIFFLQFISWGILYGLSLVLSSISDDCYYINGSFSKYHHLCYESVSVLVVTYAIVGVAYLIGLVLNLHFCFSVRAYYRNLLKAQAVESTTATTFDNNGMAITSSRSVQGSPEVTQA